MKDEKEIGSLERYGKRSPFSVPDGYFESFPGRVQMRLHAEKPAHITIAGRILQTVKPQFALAAAITILALIGYLGYNTFFITHDDMLSNENIAEYIDHYQHEFSEYELLSILNYDEFEQDDDIYSADIDYYIEYLYENNIDIELILTEF